MGDSLGGEGTEVVLLEHPDSPPGPVQGLRARVLVQGGRRLGLVFRLEGALEGLRLPPPGLARRGDRLWEHTCFEVFLAPAGSAAYHEVNLSPSGEWAEYPFLSYRERGPAGPPLAPGLETSTVPGCLELAVSLDLGRLPLLAGASSLRVGLSAVTEDSAGRLSHWALRHPPGRPDFHRMEAFALALDVGQPVPATGPGAGRGG